MASSYTYVGLAADHCSASSRQTQPGENFRCDAGLSAFSVSPGKTNFG